jgi:Domain of unknown function (DUF6894)
MSQVYFHCTAGEAVLVDRGGTDVADLVDAHDQAIQFVGSLIATPGREDWRDWILHVSDEDGEEIFLLPFSSVLGPLH